MNAFKTRVDEFRTIGFVSLGLEFARSHGAEYACALMEEIGASGDAIVLMLKQFADEELATAKTNGEL